jgi:hypothetical protein
LRRAGAFLGSHLASGLLTVLAMYGAANVALVFPVGIIDFMLLYAWVLTLILLPIQAGVQLWSALHLSPTPILLTYYFQYDATRTLPHRFLDPVRSRIGLGTVIILLLGGLVAWPVYTILGGFLLVAHFGPRLFTLDALLQFIRGLAVGVAALFVLYFVLASLAIVIVQWRRSFR